MTSAARTGRRKARSRRGDGARLGALGRPGRAFTLLEVILAITLLVALASAGAFALVSWYDGRNLEEGAVQFEALVRMARADAANTKRSIRLSFEPDTGAIRVLWEPQPFTEPRVFVEYDTSVWAAEVPNGLVRVTRCELTGDSAYSTLDTETLAPPDPGEVRMDPVTFHPDGTSDSAVIELATAGDEDDSRRAVIVIDGTNRTIETQVLGETGLAEFYEQIKQQAEAEREYYLGE